MICNEVREYFVLEEGAGRAAFGTFKRQLVDISGTTSPISHLKQLNVSLHSQLRILHNDSNYKAIDRRTLTPPTYTHQQSWQTSHLLP